MKTKDLAQIKNKTFEDLYKLVTEKEKQLATTLIEQKLAKAKNVHLPNKLRKDLAQIKTILSLKIINERTKKNNEKEIKEDQK